MSDADPAPPIDYVDFRRVDIRVGTIVAVEAFPEARRPAVKLQVDFGPAIGLKKSSAQITRNYRSETLVAPQLPAVFISPPKQSGGSMSEVLVLGFPDSAGEVVLIEPTQAVPNGG